MKPLIRQGLSALLSFALASQLFPAALASSPDVPITEDVFPDAIFRQWLTDPANLDGAGADSVFTQEELEDIRQINVSSMGISSLGGHRSILRPGVSRLQGQCPEGAGRTAKPRPALSAVRL